MVKSVLPDSAELDALFAPARHSRALLLAVSGGPDSMALLRLAAFWRDAGGAPPLHVATVDHGLRTEARAEAGQVAAAAAAVGLPHRLLVWQGVKPAARLQEAAREARYRLLAAHAEECGADMLMLAHHRDDQAETVLFRLLRGSGVDGLGSMRMLVRVGPLTLFRPFLDWPKARLVEICSALGQDFVDDPSNRDPRFARSGLRALAPSLAAQGLDAAALARLAGRAARASDALAGRAQTVALSLARPGEAGAQEWLDATPLRAEPEEIVLRVLGILLASAAGDGLRATRLRLDRLEQLTGKVIRALRDAAPLAATLAGARITLNAKGHLKLRPEGSRTRGLGAARRAR